VPQPPGLRVGSTLVGVLVAVVLLAGALLLVYQLAKQAFGLGDDSAPDATTSATSTTPTQTSSPLTVAGVSSYDLESTGGNGEENEEQAPRAIDGDPATAWTTVNYTSSMESQGKSGVGIVLDLGADHTVTSVELTLLTAGGKVELRAAAEGSTAIPDSIDGFTVFAQQDSPAIDLTLAPTAPVVTRYVLVWFTELPPYQGALKDGVAEAVVLGH
jgi:putative peptidoglycan lipid II flippase